MSGWDEGATTYTYQGFRDEEDEGVNSDKMPPHGILPAPMLILLFGSRPCPTLSTPYYFFPIAVVKRNLLAFIREFNEKNGKYIYRCTLAPPVYPPRESLELIHDADVFFSQGAAR